MLKGECRQPWATKIGPSRNGRQTTARPPPPPPPRSASPPDTNRCWRTRTRTRCPSRCPSVHRRADRVARRSGGEAAGLPKRLAEHHRAGDRHVERTQARLHRHLQPGLGEARAPRPARRRFRGRGRGRRRRGRRSRSSRFRRGSSKGRGGRPPIAQERRPRCEAAHPAPLEVIEAGPAQVPVAEEEAARLDDVAADAEAGGEPE